MPLVILTVIHCLHSELRSCLVSEGSQMSFCLISDVHEWMNEIPTVPSYYLERVQYVSIQFLVYQKYEHV